MKERVKTILNAKKIAILGFGVEGRASYKFIRKYFPDKILGVFDKREEIVCDDIFNNDKYCILYTGIHYLDEISQYDLIIKSPGISYKETENIEYKGKVLSQTGIFLELFSSQIIGITGTKGKSTTSSLLYHVLKSAGTDVVLVGNIGIPPFDEIEKIKKDTFIIYELSSHQLEHVEISPHIGVVLNIFQEHLDHYRNFDDYKLAKMRIARYQKEGDYFIYNGDNENITKLLNSNKEGSQHFSFSKKNEVEQGAYYNGSLLKFKLPNNTFTYTDEQVKRNLPGVHNLMNISVVIMICKIIGMDERVMLNGISTFNPLPHRLEYVGQFNGKHFYNDSIATIPEAAIEAIKTLNNIDTLLTGGFDRGIEYKNFVEFLLASKINKIVFMGSAGTRMYNIINTYKHKKQSFWFDNFDEAARKAIDITDKGATCLMSPAAASYGMFNNFKERGERYVQLIKGEQ